MVPGFILFVLSSLYFPSVGDRFARENGRVNIVKVDLQLFDETDDELVRVSRVPRELGAGRLS